MNVSGPKIAFESRSPTYPLSTSYTHQVSPYLPLQQVTGHQFVREALTNTEALDACNET